MMPLPWVFVFCAVFFVFFSVNLYVSYFSFSSKGLCASSKKPSNLFSW